MNSGNSQNVQGGAPKEDYVDKGTYSPTMIRDRYQN